MSVISNKEDFLRKIKLISYPELDLGTIFLMQNSRFKINRKVGYKKRYIQNDYEYTLIMQIKITTNDLPFQLFVHYPF